MKNENELSFDILKITAIIAERFPELSKYIGGMPRKISSTGGIEISNRNLRNYYDSLDELLTNYIANHVKVSIENSKNFS